MSQTLLAAVLVGGGLGLIVTSLLSRVRRREEELSDILDLPYGEHDVPIEAVLDRTAMFEGTVAMAGRMIDQIDTKGSLTTKLERAYLPIRPGEYLMLATGGSLALAVLLTAITTRWVFAFAGLAIGIGLAIAYPNQRIRSRQRAFSNQLPDALALIAGSLSAGHTFLRAIQMMTEEAEPPMADEFARVVQETRLGDSVVDALDRMAQRLQVRDLVWVVQAIRIQQTVGGKLADLLHTLADFMRSREEVRREIMVLTAEGRISAWVLAGLPAFLLVAVQVVSPGYMDPLFHGTGILLLAATVVSVAIGTAIILRMVKIEV